MRPLVLLPPRSEKWIDRYRLIGELASGGMGAVWLAHLGGAGGFKRLVALKRLHPQYAKEDEFVAMFLDEARLAAAIHHRNVVSVLEVGDAHGEPFLVMEYVEGASLRTLVKPARLAQHPVPRAVILRVLTDALRGLHAAHEQVGDDGRPLELVHRDFSPHNILVGLDGVSRLTDFGVARARARIHNTKQGATKGKIAYMAPEQAEGAPVDRRADLFAVGVVLWESLAARHLFETEGEIETLHRLLTYDPPRLDELIPSIPPALADVAARALAREPEGRFASAEEMALAIQQAVGEAAIASQEQVERFMKKRYGAAANERRAQLRTWFSEASESRSHPPSGVGLDLEAISSIPSSPLAATQLAPSEANAARSLPHHPGRERPLPSFTMASAEAEGLAVELSRTDDARGEELRREVLAALGRRGVAGRLRLRGRDLELTFQPGEPPSTVSVGDWLDQFALLPPETNQKRAEEVARRLQKSRGGRTFDPVADAYARERLKRVATGLLVLAVAGAVVFWLWQQRFFGNDPFALLGFGAEATPSASAAPLDPPDVRARRACEAARAQMLAKGSMGMDAEGWLVELWLAQAGSSPLAEQRALTRLAKEGAVGELGVAGAGDIRLVPGRFGEHQTVTVQLAEGYAVPYFQSEGRQRYLEFASRVAEAVKADHAALYARCAHLDSRDVPAWFAGTSREAALAAL
ncbi:MAG: serine/threonine protein kinase, partial [Myxococcales bacterium]|nr:serine/threonine protein kinase [Myxococcales bacterium]